MGVQARPAIDRFEEKIERTETCWLWTATINAGGYGMFHSQHNRKFVRAHRWAYENWNGPIPEGYVIDHLCRVRRCVNPAHLEAVTQRENLLRGEGPTATNAAKTHCNNGHEYTEENTMKRGEFGRECRPCYRAASNRRYAARSASLVKGGS